MDAATLHSRIRTISTAINVLEPQATTRMNDTDASPIINVYHHISILLSRGEDKAGGGRGIAVTGSHSRSITAVIAADEDPSIEDCSSPTAHFAFTQNPNKKSGAKLVIKHVKPSGKSLQVLAVVSDTVNVYAHAADVLQALALYHTTMLQEDLDALQESAFRETYTRILQEWKYDDAIDNLGELDGFYHIVSPRLHGYFVSARVPFQDTTGQSGHQGRGYLLSKDEAIGWVNVLGNILISFSKGIQGFKSDQNEESLQSLVEDQKDLVVYLYRTPVVSTIFALPSFTTLFHAHRHSPKPVPWMDITANIGDDKAGDENEVDIMLAEDHEHPGQYALRYVKTLAAWEYAISKTTPLKVFHKNMAPRLFIVDTPRLQNMAMTSISDLIDELKPRLVTEYFEETSVDEALAKFVTYFNQHKRVFGGTVHCEASLMGLTVLYMTELRGWTNSKEFFVAQLTVEERKLFEELNGVIGVAKKCCFCCHELAGRLARAIDDTEMKFKFAVPGTSGVVFPWSPPLIGIPLQVLQDLSSTLMTKLATKLQRYIAGTAKPIQSTQSSPSPSNPGEAPFDLTRRIPIQIV